MVNDNTPALATLIAGADRCVLCGLCMPHCTTYRTTPEEAESPRGRIALIRGYASGQLAYNAKLQQHLDHCLGCQACERVCPAEVPYTELLDQTKALLLAHKPKTGYSRLADFALLRLIPYPQRLRQLRQILQLLQHTGFLHWLQHRPWLAKTRLPGLLQLLPSLPTDTVPHGWNSYYPPQAPNRGSVALFTGCVAAVVEAATLQAAITLLTRMGFGVYVPAAQTCCGALHQHNGHLAQAAQLQQRNATVFAALPIEAVITTATGCQASLQSLPLTVYDIHSFIQQWGQALAFRACAQSVLVHEPCTLQSADKTQLYALLARVPGLQAKPLAHQRFCCGAGGSHLLQYPELAAQMLADKLQAIEQSGLTTVLTPNVGCALHFAKQAPHLTIQHPLVLLASLL